MSVPSRGAAAGAPAGGRRLDAVAPGELVLLASVFVVAAMFIALGLIVAAAIHG